MLLNLPLPFSQSLVTCDPVDVRNARNAVLETLPHMLSSMALLWGVVTKEEGQRRASDSAQSSRHVSTSVYFKCTQVCMEMGHLYCVLLLILYCVCYIITYHKSFNLCLIRFYDRGYWSFCSL